MPPRRKSLFYRGINERYQKLSLSAILPILMIDSAKPLLIDQPEDNLDNGFIYETVVHALRDIKTRRQLLFVTHNPLSQFSAMPNAWW